MDEIIVYVSDGMYIFGRTFLVPYSFLLVYWSESPKTPMLCGGVNVAVRCSRNELIIFILYTSADEDVHNIRLQIYFN